MLQDIRAIFFDLDDTLCGYWEASKKGLFRTFQEHGPEGYPPEEMVRHWAAAFREFAPTIKKTHWYDIYLKNGGPTRTEQMRLTLQRLGIVDPDRAEQLSQRYMEERDKGLVLFEDAREVLDKVHGRYPLGLVTNGPADIQRMEVATLGIEPLFETILIEGEMGVGKPDPSVFDRAEKSVGLAPEQILFVGNSYAHDIAPALAAGWKGVWVRRPTDVPPSAGPGLAKPEEMPPGGAEPTAIVGDLRDLLPMLGLS